MDPLTAFAVAFVFAALRYLPVMVLPALSPLAWAPVQLRVVLMLALAWLTMLSLPDGQLSQLPGGALALVLAALGELLVGAVFGLAFLLPRAALHTSGWLLDMQAGLGAAVLFNPASASDTESLLGHALMLAATVLFFVLDLHLQLFKAIALSMHGLPLGRMGLHVQPEAFLHMLGTAFIGGLMVVAPVVVGLFCVDLGVGYATRSMPQANVYFLALPLKVAVAIGLLALTLGYAPLLMGRLFGGAFGQLPAVLGAP
jgi:flagellar biosynthetic protein FliR